MQNQIVALSPTDLAPAQASLTEWCAGRIAHWEAEQAEADASLQHAIKNKWKSEPFKRALDKAARKIRFYEKIRAAIQAGYLIVPNFPMEVFAIRSKAKSARQDSSTSHWQRFPQIAQALPEGEGKYLNPVPTRDQYTDKDAKGNDVTHYFPTDLTDELEIPLHLVKPGIMRAVDKARHERLFDSIGISTDRRGDPLVLGRIQERGSHGSKQVTFFLAWFVDLNDI